MRACRCVYAPATFALAYDDAAVQGIVSGQSVGAQGAILNESFADLITSQVVGGTNYASPASGTEAISRLMTKPNRGGSAAVNTTPSR